MITFGILAPLSLIAPLCTILPNHISANQGPASRFVVEANTEALVSKSNSRRSEYMMVRGQSIRP